MTGFIVELLPSGTATGQRGLVLRREHAIPKGVTAHIDNCNATCEVGEGADGRRKGWPIAWRVLEGRG